METKATKRMNRDVSIGVGLATASVVSELAMIKTGVNPELGIVPIAVLGGVAGVLIKDFVGVVTETTNQIKENTVFYRKKAESTILFGDDSKPHVRR